MIPVSGATTRATTVGLSLPIDLLNSIDTLRGDIPRSKYILRLLKLGMDVQAGRNNKKE